MKNSVILRLVSIILVFFMLLSALGASSSAVYAATLSFTNLQPSSITTSQSTYDATLTATGTNFNNVNQVTFTWSGPDSGSSTWNRGDSTWNARLTVNSDTSMTLIPRVLYNDSGTQTKTWSWTVTLRDTTGATASRYFTVTYIPTTPLSFTNLQPSSITSSQSTYDATLTATGTNFNNVNQVTFTWSGPDSGSSTWNRGDSTWNARVTVNSDTSMTLIPRVLYNESGTQTKTWTWTVTLRDTTGATASRSFTVTYTPTQPALSFTNLQPPSITSSDPTYNAELTATGTNFNNVNRVTFTWSGPDSGTDTWDKGSSTWNSRVIINSALSMVLIPRVLYNESGTQPQTWIWTVTLRDTTGATASQYFTVTYTPTTPTPPVGEYVRVSDTGGIGLRLRSGPSLGSTTIVVMPEASLVMVLNNQSIFADGFTWWNVRYNTLEGWAAALYFKAIEVDNEAPYQPVELAQVASDGVSMIPAEGIITEGTVIFSGRVSDPNGDQVIMQVQISEENDGYEFKGAPLNSKSVGSGATATVTVTGLASGNYRWRARAVDPNGGASAWVIFGPADGVKPDFTVQVTRGPVALFKYLPSAPLQGQEITFDGSDSHGRTAAITSYQWTFGDGSSLTTENTQVTHHYLDAGQYTVVLEVVDAGNLRDTASLTISIGAADYVQAVDELINSAKTNIDQILGQANKVNESADYFLNDIYQAKGEATIKGVIGVIELVTAPILKYAVQGLFKKEVTVLIGEMRLRVGEDVVEGVCVYLEKGEGSLLHVAVDKSYGLVARQFVTAALKLLGDYVGDYINQNGSISGAQERLVESINNLTSQAKAELNDMRETLILELAELDQGARDQFLTEISRRSDANDAIAEEFTKYVDFPTTFQEKKEQYASNIVLIGTELIARVGIGIGITYLTGGGVLLVAGMAGVSFMGTMGELSSIVQGLTTDELMYSLSLSLMENASIELEAIRDNVSSLLNDIQQETPPPVVGGTILVVKHTSQGLMQVAPGTLLDSIQSFLGKKAYSDVTILNTGAVTTTYRLYASYPALIEVHQFLGGMFPITAEIPRILVKEISLEPNGQGTVRVDYLSDLGTLGTVMPKYDVEFTLIAVNGDATYCLEKRIEKFGTTLVDEQGNVIPPETAINLEIREYPLRWHVIAGPDPDQYTVCVHITNFMDNAALVGISQVLPAGMDIVSVEGGVATDNRIYWETVLDKGEQRLLTAVISAKTNREAIADLLPPVMDLYVQIMDTWESFTADSAPIPPYMPGDPLPVAGGEGAYDDIELRWSGGHADPGQEVTYKIYFGESEIPPLLDTIGPVSATETSLFYAPGTLKPGTVYYWSIAAIDSDGAMSFGPIWSFTTVGQFSMSGIIQDVDVENNFVIVRPYNEETQVKVNLCKDTKLFGVFLPFDPANPPYDMMTFTPVLVPITINDLRPNDYVFIKTNTDIDGKVEINGADVDFLHRLPGNGWDLPEAASGFQRPMVNDHYGHQFLEDVDGVPYPGVDYNGPGEGDADLDTPIYSVANGAVLKIDDEGWGSIVIAHVYQGEWVYSQYSHLGPDRILVVNQGQFVTKGQLIGRVGNWETDTAHLHWEIRKGTHPDYMDASYWPYYVTEIESWAEREEEIRNIYYDPEQWVDASGAYEPVDRYDITPPAAVADLSVSDVTETSISLSWTSPGDDADLGTASEYDIRYSASTIADENWDDADQCTGEPTPYPIGRNQTIVITDLAAGTTYYFALKTRDEMANYSMLSNVVSGTTTGVGPKTWYVDDDLLDYPAADFTAIQEAVDEASPGDTIIVYPGTYTENVDVNKDHLTIQSENGAETTIVQAANPDDHVLEITADYAEIGGFTIRYANGRDSQYITGTYLGSAGIYLKTVTSCTIINNNILENTDGIFFDFCVNIRLLENKIARNNACGVWWLHSDGSIISRNNITNSVLGMYGAFTSDNVVSDNIVTVDEGAIALQDSSDSEISGNTVSAKGSGISLYSNSYGNLVFGNYISACNEPGMQLADAFNNTITGNTITNSTGSGLHITSIVYSSLNNVIYANNFMTNNPNVYSQAATNIWNSPTEITHTYNGNQYTDYLGNYWDDYTGSDADGDGIGDTPYPIDSDADNYPLVEPFENYVIGGGTTPPTVNLSLYKSDGWGQGWIHFDLTVSNSGTAAADNVTVVDTLPWDLSFDYASDKGIWSEEDRTVTWYLGTIESGTSRYLYLDAWCYYWAFGENHASVNTTTAESNYEDNEAVGYYESWPPYQFDFGVSGLSGAAQGSEITYSLYYQNLCSFLGDAENVTIVDTLAPEVSFVSASSGGTYADGTVTWDLGSGPLNYGEVTVTVKVADNAPVGSEIANSAYISSKNEFPYPIDNYTYALWYTTVLEGANLILSKDSSPTKVQGSMMTYTIYYQNFGTEPAENVVISDTLPPEVVYYSSSNDGDCPTPPGNIVTWNLGTVEGLEHGYVTVTVEIGDSVPVGTVVTNQATINSTTPETCYDDNEAVATTTIIDLPLPPNVGVEPNNGGTATISVNYYDLITFSFDSCDEATGVDINIHINDGGSDINGTMIEGPAHYWTYATTFSPRYGETAVTYTVYGCPGGTEEIDFGIYIDPAGYVYDVITGLRINGAYVWLQRPDGYGGWENVPTGVSPANMNPDVNPLVTGVDGQYQWDVLEGCYRVHVEADGYYSLDSIIVTIPPPVTDLYIGLTPVNKPPVADAGPDQTVCAIPPATTAMVTLDGSGSCDADGDPLTYNWTWDGNTAYGLNPIVELAPGTTTITLVVNDGKVDSEPDIVDIIVRIPATIDFDPDTLNLKDKGKYVTVYIELPPGYDVNQIDVSSIRLNGTVPALAKPTKVGDYDKDGMPDLMVKFDRVAVGSILTPDEQVEITITGQVAGITFEGSDTIRVIGRVYGKIFALLMLLLKVLFG